MEGSELAPLATAPLGATLIKFVVGVQLDEPPATTCLLKQVSRRKIALEVLTGLTTRFVEVDAKTTNSPD
jgi:hypothetical protein